MWEYWGRERGGGGKAGGDVVDPKEWLGLWVGLELGIEMRVVRVIEDDNCLE
jgi:hypothetical protein